MQTLQETVTIINKLGLHTRAAAKLVAIAAKFESRIQLVKSDQTADAKSIMGMLTLGASQGTQLDLIITGNDSQAARNAIVELINNRFGEPD